MRNANYRILTYSNGKFVPEYRFLFLWFSYWEEFKSIVEAKEFIENEKILSQRPIVVNTSYFE